MIDYRQLKQFIITIFTKVWTFNTFHSGRQEMHLRWFNWKKTLEFAFLRKIMPLKLRVQTCHLSKMGKLSKNPLHIAAFWFFQLCVRILWVDTCESMEIYEVITKSKNSYKNEIFCNFMRFAFFQTTASISFNSKFKQLPFWNIHKNLQFVMLKFIITKC